MSERKKTGKLRSGFTTGAAAAAAVKGALYLLINGKPPETVRIRFISGGHQDIKIHYAALEGNRATCTVIKDAGDDPDVTNKAEIGVHVTMNKRKPVSLQIVGGKGVGVVTKPGLENLPGEPAISSGPRKMIQTSIDDVFSDLAKPLSSVHVEVFVPHGEVLAHKTLNPRLGIKGGISILGTTGIVRPMSHEAYVATIQSALSVAKASGLNRVFFTTGRRSERYAQKIWPDEPEEAFIQIGDFFKLSLETASTMGFQMVVLTVFFGKAVKMAYGYPHTHAGKSDMSMKKLSRWTREITGDVEMADNVLCANTARQAFFMLKDVYPQVIAHVGRRMVEAADGFIPGDTKVRSAILDFEGGVTFDSQHPENGQ